MSEKLDYQINNLKKKIQLTYNWQKSNAGSSM